VRLEDDAPKVREGWKRLFLVGWLAAWDRRALIPNVLRLLDAFLFLSAGTVWLPLHWDSWISLTASATRHSF